MSTAYLDDSDPLIDEVRERRRKLYEQCGYSLERLFEEIQRLQAEHPDKIVDPRRNKPKDRS
jgi:hypothetical protein